MHNYNKLKKQKKTSPPREECRHQIEGVGRVKWGVDVARADWLWVREVTPHLEECPLHPYTAMAGFKD
ncbi:hypothetical protein Hanom_Chr14g01287131 [Helianthus anomalus]